MTSVINNKISATLAGRLLKISQVSRDTGISRTTLTNLYYRRSKAVSFDTLDKLCKYLHCGIDDILDYTATEPQPIIRKENTK